MIITRRRPNDHTTGGMTFHPGAQFVSDDFYRKHLKDNADFQEQIESGLMEITLSCDEAKDKSVKSTIQKTSLAETVAALPEKNAIRIIKTIIDGVELKEISKLDKRRDVVAAAEAQIEARQMTMNGMAPIIPPANGDIAIGDFE